MPEFSQEHDSLQGAQRLDLDDPLHSFRDEFHIPLTPNNTPQFYFAGHSLGLMPKHAREYIDLELDEWSRLGVAGHFSAKNPWLPYHETVSENLAHIVGAQPNEVVAMNSLTANLHLMLVSFYRPTSSRFRVLIENNAFPSDRYAVDSQTRFHGFDPSRAVVELKPRVTDSDVAMTLETEQILRQIYALGDSLAVVMLGQCNYLSGQAFETAEIVKAARKVGAFVGFNLAHGAGNLLLKLHDENVDFAVWCSYKYLNSGPGGIAGAFVHERHLQDRNIPRFAGWWGHNKQTRFEMGPKFDPIPTAESWQLSNPPIFQLAALRASTEIFTRATMPALRKKSELLTGYLEWLLKRHLGEKVEIVTPAQERGAMLCMRLLSAGGAEHATESPLTHAHKQIEAKLKERGAVVDFREPDIFRMAPVPLYNSFEDVYRLVTVLRETL